MFLKRLFVSAALCVVLGGCGAHSVPKVARGPHTDPAPVLEIDSTDRYIEQITYRVRNLTCDGLYMGSGFAIGFNMIVTNHHVAAGAQRVELNSWTGETLRASVQGVAHDDDLAVLLIEDLTSKFAQLATETPDIGDTIRTAGFPRGNAFQLSTGFFIGMGVGPTGSKRLTYADPKVTHGNSGGPVVNDQAQVVGVLTEGEPGTNATRYAIPVDRVKALRTESLDPPSRCEQ